MTFLIQQTMIYAVPLMIVALAGVFAERSGIINLALEGIMILGAFIGVLFVNIMQTNHVYDAAKAAGDWVALQGFELLAMLVAAIFGAIFSLLLSFASVNLRADQTIGGTALNLMAPALVLFLIRIIANQNTLQMATGDAASWFMIKKTTLGYAKTDDLGFLGNTFLHKVYLATYICIIIFVVLAICSFFFVAPGADFVAPAGKGGKVAVKTAGHDHKPLEMVKKPTFWLYYVWAIAVSAAGLALISQASGVVWEASVDQTASSVATIVGLISICNALGRVLFGGMYDKYGRKVSMQLVNVLFIITSVVLILALSTRSIVVVIIGFVLGGLAYSGVTPTNSAFCRAYFGPAHYPVNFPLINSNLIFASFGSTISGALFDASGSYNATFFLIIGLAAAGILCSLGISVCDRKSK